MILDIRQRAVEPLRIVAHGSHGDVEVRSRASPASELRCNTADNNELDPVA
jgi:hypothetical protein